MSRSKLFLAAALLLMPLGARADLPLQVHLYGFLDAEVEWARAVGGSTPYTARIRVADGNSRLGLFGSYDIGPATQVNVQLEGFLNNFEQGGVNDLGQSATLESRNTYVGIVDQRFGTLLAGYYDNAYRALVGTGGNFGGNLGLTEIGLDVWNNTSAAVSGGFTSLFGRGEARLANSIHYRTPDLFGLRAMVSYGVDESEAIGGRRDHISAGAFYSSPFGLKIGFGFDHQSNTGIDTDALLKGYGFRTAPVDDVATNFYKVIVSYMAPTRTYIGFGYERAVYGYNNFYPPAYNQYYSPLTYGDMSQGGAMISLAQVLFENLTVMGSYGRLGPLSNSIVGNGSDYQAKQLSIGAKYAFGPSFMAYIYFTRIENGALQSLNLGAPIYSNNLGTSGAYLAPGDRPMAGGTGMIARF